MVRKQRKKLFAYDGDDTKDNKAENGVVTRVLGLSNPGCERD